MKRIIIFLVTLTSLTLQAQVISPPLAGGELDMSNQSSALINISNTSGTAKSLSLSVGTGFEIALNRCPMTLAHNKVCSFRVNVKPELLSSGINIVPIMNGSSSLGNLKYVKSNSGEIKSISVSSPSLNFGTITQLGNSTPQYITVTNTGNVMVSPIISLPPNVKIAINRCTTPIKPNQSCSIGIVYAATSGSSNGVQAPQEISIKKDVSDVGSPVLVSASLNVVLSCSGLQHQENNQCVSNIRSCSIPNGSGVEAWSSGSWGTCAATSCDVDYVISNSQCVYSLYTVKEALSVGGGGGIYAGWEPTEAMIIQISQKTKLTELSFEGYMTGGTPQTAIIVSNSYSSTMGRSGDTSVTILGQSSPNSFTGGMSVVTFLFNNGDVILNPGTYYLGFTRTWSGALWHNYASSYNVSGPHHLVYNPGFNITNVGPIFKVKGQYVP